MRLPATKIWRSFPALDRFSDEECAVYVAHLNRWYITAGAVSIALITGAILFPTIGAMLSALLRAMRPLANQTAESAVILGGVAAFGAGASLAGFLSRDVLLHLRIRRGIRRAICAQCAHSLLGLPLLPDALAPSVRCPECGFAISLELLGITPEDLIPRESAATGRSVAGSHDVAG